MRRFWHAVSGLLVLMGLGYLVFRVPADLILEQHLAVSATLVIVVIALEVVIAPIPGGVLGYLTGAYLGFWRAWPLLYLGNVIGMIIAFQLANTIGRPYLERTVNPRRRKRLERFVSGKPALLWLAYAVPIMPIDALTILSGLLLKKRQFYPYALTGLIVYTGIVAATGAFGLVQLQFLDAAGLIGLGVLGLIGGGVWLYLRRRHTASSGT